MKHFNRFAKFLITCSAIAVFTGCAAEKLEMKNTACTVSSMTDSGVVASCNDINGPVNLDINGRNIVDSKNGLLTTNSTFNMEYTEKENTVIPVSIVVTEGAELNSPIVNDTGTITAIDETTVTMDVNGKSKVYKFDNPISQDTIISNSNTMPDIGDTVTILYEYCDDDCLAQKIIFNVEETQESVENS